MRTRGKLDKNSISCLAKTPPNPQPPWNCADHLQGPFGASFHASRLILQALLWWTDPWGHEPPQRALPGQGPLKAIIDDSAHLLDTVSLGSSPPIVLSYTESWVVTREVKRYHGWLSFLIPENSLTSPAYRKQYIVSFWEERALYDELETLQTFLT